MRQNEFEARVNHLVSAFRDLSVGIDHRVIGCAAETLLAEMLAIGQFADGDGFDMAKRIADRLPQMVAGALECIREPEPAGDARTLVEGTA